MRRGKQLGPSGFGEHITRRDFLNGVAFGMGAAVTATASGCGAPSSGTADQSLDADWYGYGGVGSFRDSHGNTPEVVSVAHRLRDGSVPTSFDSVRFAEEYDLVIVGAGMAGLGAALDFFKNREVGQSCLVLDNHPMVGGEAKENEFDVMGERLIGPQGANGFFIPEAVGDPDAATGDPRYFAELGLPREFTFREWDSDEEPLRFCRDNYGYLVAGLQHNTSVGHFFWRWHVWIVGRGHVPTSPREHPSLGRRSTKFTHLV